MKRLSLCAVVLLAGAGWISMTAPTVRGQGDGPSRDEVVQAFSDLSKQAKSAYTSESMPKVAFGKRAEDAVPARVYNGTGVPFFKGVPIKNQQTKLIIKVWAVPLDDAGQPTRDKVALDKYLWRPKQRFAVFIDSAVPVQVGIYQDFPNQPSERRLPDPEFPKSYQTVQGGDGPYRFPFDIELDDNLNDELMSIVVVAAGAEPKLHVADKKVSTISGNDYVAFAKRYGEAFDQAAIAARKIYFKAVPPGLESSPNVDDVALIAYGPDQRGQLQIRIRKKKN